MTRSPHNNQFQFAPATPPRSAAIGGRRSPSLLASAATTLNHDQMATRSTGWGVPVHSCVFPPARDRQGFGHSSGVGLGRGFSLTALFHVATQTTNLAERFGARSSFRAIRGIGRRVNADLIAINPYAADHSGNDAVEPLKRHFVSPFSVANKPSDGAIGSDQKAIGVSQNVYC